MVSSRSALSLLLRYSAANPEAQFFGLSSDSIVVPVGPGDSDLQLNGCRVARGGVGVYPLLGRLCGISTLG